MINSANIPPDGILFKDVPIKGFFYLEPTDSAQACVKLDSERYSCGGIVYFCASEQIVYVKKLK